MALELRDTVREVTTITIDRNETGDTLRLTQVTERERSRERDRFRVQDSRVVVVHDTVYVERKDTVAVEKNTNFSNGTNKSSNFVSSLKWIFWILCAIVVLIITVRIGMRRSLF